VKLDGAHVVVTGGGSGIGAALARRFAGDRPGGVVVADIDREAAERVAAAIGEDGVEAAAVEADVGSEAGIEALVARAEERFGPVDVFCSNAGIGGERGGPEVGDAAWQRIWEVNVMAHVWAARLLLPGMLERRHGHLSSTASAAGLLANPGLMTYSVTKHAAVAVAEWLAITYGEPDGGVSFSCLCPQWVDTPLLEHWHEEDPSSRALTGAGTTIAPEQAAEALLGAIREGRFLALPHPEVGTFMERRGADHQRWLAGMQRVQAEIDRARGNG